MAAATQTVQNILDKVQRDLLNTFMYGGGASTTAPAVLIDYVDRVQQDILGRRPWNWMLSTPKRFITERGQSDYWVGTLAGQAAGQVDTLLNLTDVRRVMQGSVSSRSGFRRIFSVEEGPLAWQNEDGSYQEGVPHSYRNDEGAPNVISLYPAPDLGSNYELVPQAPHSTTAAGGALAARTYFIRTTFVDLAGNEGEPSTTARQFVEASKLITVKAPQPAHSPGSGGISYLRWNVYASTTEGSEQLQASNTATSADWTEPASGLITGAAVPTTFSLDPLRGYVIEFRYYKAHTLLTAVGNTLLIPNEFRDVVVAGVNRLAARYLPGKGDLAALWERDYETGLARMSMDQNPWPGATRYIHPDSRSYVSHDPSGGGGGRTWWNPDPG